MIWSSRERNRSRSLVSRRSRGRIAKFPAPSARARRITACDSRESSKLNLQAKAPLGPKIGKFDYLSAPGHSAHSMASEFFTDDYLITRRSRRRGGGCPGSYLARKPQKPFPSFQCIGLKPKYLST